MFFLAVMGFFISAISGLHFMLDGYVFHGIPSFIVSGVIPVAAAFLKSRGGSCDLDCPDCGDCGDCTDCSNFEC